MSARGIAPIVGVIGLLAVVTTLGGIVAAVVPTVVDEQPVEPVVIDLEASADGTLEYTLRSGDPIDVTDLEVTISINDEPLAKQPSVPSVTNEGFVDTPKGPFHAWSTTVWRPGDIATLVVAKSNDPSIAPGDTVETTLTLDGQRLAEVAATVSG